MFNKLISNLPFNPSLIDQVSFYGRRLKQESSIRRAGFILTALTLIIQVAAVAAHPQATQAASNDNDLIPGGITSQQDAVAKCQSDYHYYELILAWYGISCADIASPNTSVVSLHSTDYSGNLWSVGHLPYGLAGETRVSVWGSYLYWRPLHSWDTGAYSTYTALKFTNDAGATFFILYNCGNIVSIGFPQPYHAPTPTPTPAPKPTPTPAPTPQPCPIDSSITVDNSSCQPCPYNNSVILSDAACKPCNASQSQGDVLACLSVSKSASNLTENISDANNTTAKPGDVIQYTLIAQNNGKGTINKFVVQENLGDVLEYADLQKSGGGSLGDMGILSWPAVDIAAGQTIQEQFTVKVKAPVPQTTPSAANPEGYNLVMTNVYGNVINIKLPKGVIKSSVQVAQVLPNTGPGSSIIIGSLLVVVVGYFFARSRLLAKEVDIVKADFNTHGE